MMHSACNWQFLCYFTKELLKTILDIILLLKYLFTFFFYIYIFLIQEIHEGLDFSAEGDEDEFGIFSVKFSTDGQELVAAGSDNLIYVYDLQANKCTLRIPAHKVS